MDLVPQLKDCAPEAAAEEQSGPELVYNVHPNPERHLPDGSLGCLRPIGRLRSFYSVSKVEVTKLHGSHSGALVLLAKPFSADGTELPSCVLKYDHKAAVIEEAANTTEHGAAWGPTHPVVRGIVHDGDWAVMEIDLCGGMLGVPGITQGSAVRTLEQIISGYVRGDAGCTLAQIEPAFAQLGAKLREWTGPTTHDQDVAAYYRTAQNVENLHVSYTLRLDAFGPRNV